MPTLTIEYRDDAERLVLEQALAYASQLSQLAQDAPEGSVLAACEQLALRSGRDLLRSTLAAALEGRIVTAEQKGGRHATVRRHTSDAPKEPTNAAC
jgi:hypothetical protein